MATDEGKEAAGDLEEGGDEQQESLSDIRTEGNWARADIPERIIKKLSRIAGLKYDDKCRLGGGGLCLGLLDENGRGAKRRRKALMVLGSLVAQIGKESTNRAVELAGATWLDIVGWREDAEYAALWAAAQKVRREVAAARLEDELWERSLNGYEVEEAKKGGSGEIEKVTVTKFDNGLGVQLLKGLGYVGKDGGARSAKALGNGKAGGGGVDPAAAGEAEGEDKVPDTVLFPDRKTAFEMMGKPRTADGAK